MKLTDADRETIIATLECCGFRASVDLARSAVYLAGKRAGREDMRERAAKVCDEHDPATERIASGRKLSRFTADCQAAIVDEERGEKIAANTLAAAIRAFGVDDD